MTNIEIIRAACVNANPEIKEIKIGCLLDLHAGESYGLVTVHQMTSVCKKHKKYREECGAEEGGCSTEEAIYGTSGNDESWWVHTVKIADIKPYQVIGRTIRLADVLLAIQKTGRPMDITSTGFFIEEIGYEEMTVHKEWDLRNDDLEAQSPECIDFLLGVLTNKE